MKSSKKEDLAFTANRELIKHALLTHENAHCCVLRVGWRSEYPPISKNTLKRILERSRINYYLYAEGQAADSCFLLL